MNVTAVFTDQPVSADIVYTALFVAEIILLYFFALYVITVATCILICWRRRTH